MERSLDSVFVWLGALVDWIVTPPPFPKWYVHIITLEPINVFILGEKKKNNKHVFEDVIKDLELRSSYISVSPKSNENSL